MEAKITARDCDGCTMCCKLIGIDALNKPRCTWCPHCDVGLGCKIYDERPEECHTFNCGYLLNERLGEEWKPDRAHLIVAYRGDFNRVSIHVDPHRPDAWRREPYYSRIVRWSANAKAKGIEPVILWLGEKRMLVTPDGRLSPGQ